MLIGVDEGIYSFLIYQFSVKWLTSRSIKETLRYHPIVTTLIRAAAKDDVIPLSHPIQSKSGKTLTCVPVKKGQRVMLSIAGYHR